MLVCLQQPPLSHICTWAHQAQRLRAAAVPSNPASSCQKVQHPVGSVTPLWPPPLQVAVKLRRGLHHQQPWAQREASSTMVSSGASSFLFFCQLPARASLLTRRAGPLPERASCAACSPSDQVDSLWFFLSMQLRNCCRSSCIAELIQAHHSPYSVCAFLISICAAWPRLI